MPYREPTAWIDRVRRRVKRWLRAGLGPRWVVAVSGGSDSVGLLRVLHALAPELALELSVAHLNHGARGAEAARDAELVVALARSLGLACDVGQWAPERSAHFEADARRARYAWLAGVAQARGAAAVAVGHTRDDQAETVLHRILRGTGPRGLAGIPRRRPLAEGVMLVRPLLDVERREIRAYLAALGQPFRDDATNADRSRTRARIRHDLLPRLAAEYNPQVAAALVRLATLAGAGERARRRRSLARLKEALRETGPHRIVLDRPPIARLHGPERADVVRLAWSRAGWPEGRMRASHWRAIARLARTGTGHLTVAGGVEVVAETDALVFHRATTDEQPEESAPRHVALPVPGEAAWPGGRVVAGLDPEAPRDETVNLDALVLPLLVRAPAPGDRFDPLGMGGHTMPLNDFLRGRHVPNARRPSIPLVCDQKGIVWVVGHRIADRARVRDNTTRTAGLRWLNSA